MSDLFSNAWMEALGKAWNADESMTKNLEKAEFDSSVGYGYKDESTPRGVLIIHQGRVVHAGEYTNQELNWDLRADLERWKFWIENGFGLARLGTAVSKGDLKFVKGDYRQMVRNIRLSVPFLRHFDLMQSLETTFRR